MVVARPLAILAAGIVASWAIMAVTVAPAAPYAPTAAVAAPAGIPAPPTAGAAAAGRTAGADLPALVLPWPAGETWHFTGGPHAAWRAPDDAAVGLDFAPPDDTGCGPSAHHATAIAAGTVTRSDTGRLWVAGPGDDDGVLYLHLADAAPVGAVLAAGDRIGRPACEGNGAGLRSRGAHVHLAVMRGGEWTLPELDGWRFTPGLATYHGHAYGPDGERICAGAFRLPMGEPGCPDAITRPASGLATTEGSEGR